MKRTAILVAVVIGLMLAAGAQSTALGFTAKVGVPCGEHWTAPTHALAKIQDAGLPALPAESLNYHTDMHLDVFTDGERQIVPAGIGVDGAARRISPLHTHFCDGVVHGESSDVRTMYLGQLFTEWGVRLTSGCVGEFCDAQGVRVFIDGTPTLICPGGVDVVSGREVALVVGRSPAQVPSTWPAAQ